MLELPNVTLLSIVHDGKNDMPNRVARVMNWCNSIIKFKRSLYLTSLKPEVTCRAELVQIPSMRLIPDVQIMIVHMLGIMDLGDFMMGVHEDGFPLDVKMWDDEYLKYDYIGSPWGDEVVGNNGFYICSKKFMQCSARLPFITHPLNSDNYMCRDHRKKMIEMGIRYAPFALARKFSVETVGTNMASFGFHGRKHSKPKYESGWKLIRSSETPPKK